MQPADPFDRRAPQRSDAEPLQGLDPVFLAWKRGVQDYQLLKLAAAELQKEGNRAAGKT